MWDPQVYVGGIVDIVDTCDLDKWSKVEIESICKEFGYTEVGKLWFKMPSVNREQSNFHQVVDDEAAMFMTDLVKGYGEIHVFVEHPVHEPLELPVEDFDPLDARLPSSELEGVDAKAFLLVTVSFKVINIMSMLSMVMKSTNLIFHNLEAMIMLNLVMLTMVSHMR